MQREWEELMLTKVDLEERERRLAAITCANPPFLYLVAIDSIPHSELCISTLESLFNSCVCTFSRNALEPACHIPAAPRFPTPSCGCHLPGMQCRGGRGGEEAHNGAGGGIEPAEDEGGGARGSTLLQPPSSPFSCFLARKRDESTSEAVEKPLHSF